MINIETIGRGRHLGSRTEPNTPRSWLLLFVDDQSDDLTAPPVCQSAHLQMDRGLPDSESQTIRLPVQRW